MEDFNNSLLNQMSEMSKRFESNLSEFRTELKSEIKITREILEVRINSLDEQMESNKAELKAEILTVKSDLSFNYHEKVGAVENRLIWLERDSLPRIES